MSRGRPSDRSGEIFLEILDDLRKRRRRAASRAPVRFEGPLLWVSEEHDPRDAPAQTATAAEGVYHLLVVEMRDAFMANKPLDMPKISWALFRGPGQENALAGAPAPTFEEGKARAELALRVQLGDKLDS